MILGGPFVSSSKDGLTGCYDECRLGDAWLTATYRERQTGRQRKGEHLERQVGKEDIQQNLVQDDKIRFLHVRKDA